MLSILALSVRKWNLRFQESVSFSESLSISQGHERSGVNVMPDDDEPNVDDLDLTGCPLQCSFTLPRTAAVEDDLFFETSSNFKSHSAQPKMTEFDSTQAKTKSHDRVVPVQDAR